MALGIWNLEHLGLRSQQSYPFCEDATRQDVTGTFELPDSFFLGIYFPVHAGLSIQPGAFYLSSLGIYGAGFSFAISYHNGADNPVVAASMVSRATHTENMAYALPGQGDFVDSVGQVVIGKLDELDAINAGEYTFNYAGGKLEVDCIRPMIKYVQSIVVLDGNNESEKLYGEITLAAGNNVRISVIESDAGSATIRIDAIDGEGLSDECVCDDDNEAPCIRRINGVAPTPAGDLTLLGDTCISIAPVTNGLQLVDSCSEPCCSCEELQALADEVSVLGVSENTVNNFANQLSAVVAQLSSVILGSRISDDGCDHCP